MISYAYMHLCMCYELVPGNRNSKLFACPSVFSSVLQTDKPTRRVIRGRPEMTIRRILDCPGYSFSIELELEPDPVRVLCAGIHNHLHNCWHKCHFHAQRIIGLCQVRT